MGELMPFSFEGRDVRTVLDDQGNPLVVAQDICSVLGLHAGAAVAKMDHSHVKSVRAGIDKLLAVTESGVYDLIFEAASLGNPMARKFQKWVTEELLPSFRRGELVPVKEPASSLDVLDGMVKTLREFEQRQTIVESRIDSIEGNNGWLTVLGYARVHGLRTEPTYLSKIGTHARRIGDAVGEAPREIHDTRYGFVNAWPEWVLTKAFAGVAP